VKIALGVVPDVYPGVMMPVKLVIVTVLETR
jgi:hypothetical protein